MEMPSLHRVTSQRALRARVYRHGAAIGDLADQAGVARRKGGTDVARDGGDAEQLKFVRRRKSQQQCDGVIDARVAIDNDGSTVHCTVRGVQALRLAI